MRQRTEQGVVVRGAGDLATATIYRLVRAGFPVLALEVARPSAIRRQVAFSEAVYQKEWRVEDMSAYLAEDLSAAQAIMKQGSPAILIDPSCSVLDKLRPWALVDAILAKRNLGTKRSMARHTIALGPGFTAGEDVDLVIETARGHDLGRIYDKGQALPNTGIPGQIAGYGIERVVRAPAEGCFQAWKEIGNLVKAGEELGQITDSSGALHPVRANISGLLRGILPSGFSVDAGFKLADVDAREEEYPNCFTISDKARAIAGSVLEALLYLEMQE